MAKLTAVAFRNLVKPGRYQDGDGLMLIVKSPSSRSWLLRIQVDGLRRDIGLGSAKILGLAEARAKAEHYRRLFKTGRDPVAEAKAASRAARTIPTFAKAAEAAHGELVAGWKNLKHREDWISSLRRYAFPILGDIRVDQITAPKVRDCLLEIWITRPETARRVRQRIRGVLDWSVGKGLREPIDLSGLSRSLPKQPKTEGHFAAMPYADVPTFFRKLEGETPTIGRLALRFTILTAARSGETRGATWDEIDLRAKEWNIPAARMKAGKNHAVPLSDPAVAILKHIEGLKAKDRSIVFPGSNDRPLSDMTLSKIMRDLGLPFTVHGFRSSFKDWASECTSFSDAVSEAALAHLDSDKVRAAYRRTDFRAKRRELMDDWAAFLTNVVANEDARRA